MKGMKIETSASCLPGHFCSVAAGVAPGMEFPRGFFTTHIRRARWWKRLSRNAVSSLLRAHVCRCCTPAPLSITPYVRICVCRCAKANAHVTRPVFAKGVGYT